LMEQKLEEISAGQLVKTTVFRWVMKKAEK
jgi:hypothetical protein